MKGVRLITGYSAVYNSPGYRNGRMDKQKMVDVRRSTHDPGSNPAVAKKFKIKVATSQRLYRMRFLSVKVRVSPFCSE